MASAQDLHRRAIALRRGEEEGGVRGRVCAVQQGRGTKLSGVKRVWLARLRALANTAAWRAVQAPSFAPPFALVAALDNGPTDTAGLPTDQRPRWSIANRYQRTLENPAQSSGGEL